jgi:hypothetical protein
MSGMTCVSPSKRTPFCSRWERAASMSRTPKTGVVPPTFGSSDWPSPIEIPLQCVSQLAPAHVVELVDHLEAEVVVVPVDRSVEIGDAARDRQVVGVLDRRVGERLGHRLLAHRCSLPGVASVLVRFYTR